MDKDKKAAQYKSLLACRIKRRKEEIQNFILARRNEIHKRLRYRRYLFHKHERMRKMPLPASLRSQCISNPAGPDWWERAVMTEFGPQDWLEKFHITRDIFFLLCAKLKPRLGQTLPRPCRQAVSLERRVAMALIRLSTSTEYRYISELFGVPVPTVCHCVREVCEAVILLLKPVYMHLPGSHELEENARQFHSQYGFPHCVGVIDSLHIPVKSPPQGPGGTAPQGCWNSRGRSSVVLQGVVNAQGTFWDVCAGFPGSTDDLTVLQSSELWTMAGQGGLCPQPSRQLLGQPLGYLLLGDAGYPLQSWLLKCYPPSAQLTPQQHTFNAHLSHCHGVITHTLRRLRARWQCLHSGNDGDLDLVPKMAVASCVLHNICNIHNVPFKDEWLLALNRSECPQPCTVAPAYMDDPNAEAVRALLCSYFHVQQRSKPHVPALPACPALPLPPHGGAAAAAQLLTML
ncbi:putative nuclease HARBI1 [Brachyhypopomus gauderio]|uniref:putative nuclease HARBI1 n=1 Tax=Brachyhypopomus gauderio TaxID=698409 RepID=UPI0040433E18